jgi:glycosyltransferase involved in cell wall biosynthesis
MRIVIVNNFAHVTGGADRHCLELTSELERRGHEVLWLATCSDRPLQRAGAFVPVTVTNDLREGLSPGMQAKVLLRAVWHRSAAGAMRAIISRYRPDVAHVHKIYPQLSVAPVAVAAAAGVPIVQTLHDYEMMAANQLDATGGLRDRVEGRMRYRVLNTCTYATRRTVHRRAVRLWIAVSHAVAHRYATKGIDAHVVPNFTRLPSPEAPGRAGREGALFLGRLAAEKGITDVLEFARDNPDIHVSVAGSGPLEATVREADKEFANLTYLGLLDAAETSVALGRACVAIMPARWEEPGPLACLEALAMGTPVIAYDAGGLAEYVHNAGGGLVTESKVAALTAAARGLLGDHGHWEALSAGARSTVEREHLVESYVDRLLPLYRHAALREPS